MPRLVPATCSWDRLWSLVSRLLVGALLVCESRYGVCKAEAATVSLDRLTVIGFCGAYLGFSSITPSGIDKSASMKSKVL
jgi:hypothetical protein